MADVARDFCSIPPPTELPKTHKYREKLGCRASSFWAL